MSSEPPILPPAPDPPPPPDPITPDVAGPAAKSSLSAVPNAFDLALGAVKGARSTINTWSDEFWAVSGYDKAAVMAALDAYDRLADQYNTDYQDEAATLRGT